MVQMVLSSSCPPTPAFNGSNPLDNPGSSEGPQLDRGLINMDQRSHREEEPSHQLPPPSSPQLREARRLRAQRQWRESFACPVMLCSRASQRRATGVDSPKRDPRIDRVISQPQQINREQAGFLGLEPGERFVCTSCFATQIAGRRRKPGGRGSMARLDLEEDLIDEAEEGEVPVQVERSMEDEAIPEWEEDMERLDLDRLDLDD